MKLRYSAVVVALACSAMSSQGWADEAAAKKWIDAEFQPSTLSKDKQAAEMKWFIEAANKLKAKGVSEIAVVSETITTHDYESKTLAKAFTEITGIKVNHDLIQEGDVVEKLQTSMQSGKSIYDGWISDSDLIGTHYRYGKIMNLTDYMTGTGKDFTTLVSTSRTSLAPVSPRHPMARCTSCQTNSLPTCTGFALTCLPALT